MKELCLDEIKDRELALLLIFKDFCYKNDITFFVSNGTLLGAVKYNGFIPWDDDVDVFVPRSDYQRLIESFRDTDDVKLFSIERTKGIGYPFAKLCDMTTVKNEVGILNVLNLGIDIDIFPLDSWGSKEIARSKQKRIGFYRRLLAFSKSSETEYENKCKLKSTFVNILVKTTKSIGSDFFVKKIIKIAKKNTSSDFSGCVVWPIYGEREIIPSEVFSDIIEVEFEGDRFPAPIGYDQYLRSLYGDYEKDPPIDKQKSHHKFTAYSI